MYDSEISDAFAIIVDGPAWLEIERSFPGIAPVELLRWFVEPELLLHWWGQEATIEPRAGGRYEVSWPSMNWTKRGQIAMFNDDTLVFSWVWDHEPELPARAVIVAAGESDGGCRVTITHGPFRQGESLTHEDEDRASHLDGWSTFVPGLKRVAEGQG